LKRADSYVDRTRQQQARAAISGGDVAGPVKL